MTKDLDVFLEGFLWSFWQWWLLVLVKGLLPTAKDASRYG